MTGERTASTFLNLDLQIRETHKGYRARILDTGNDQAAVDFVLPFSETQLENFLLRIMRRSRTLRYVSSVPLETIQAFGSWLFQAVFNQVMRDHLQHQLKQAEGQRTKLRIRLHLAGAPRLAHLPWEYLYYAKDGRSGIEGSMDEGRYFFALSSETSLIRYHHLPQARPPLAIKPPLKVLIMISTAGQQSSGNANHEWTKFRHTLSLLEQRGLVELERLERATLSALQQRLGGGKYHIFHFIGHTTYQGNTGVASLYDGGGGIVHVDGARLAALLQREKSLRLSFLNTYNHQNRVMASPLVSLTQGMMQRGIPAAIASPFEMTDEATATLIYVFYYALASGYRVDAALNRARRLIFAQQNNIEWGNPLLYLCCPGGHIFDIEVDEAFYRQRRQISRFYNEALAAYGNKNLAMAIEKLRVILTIDPVHPEARFVLRRILHRQRMVNDNTAERKGEQLDQHVDMPTWFRPVELDFEGILTPDNLLFGQAQVAMVQRNWTTAILKLEDLLETDTAHVEAARLLQEARQKSHLEALYLHGKTHYEKGNLSKALACFREIQVVDNGYEEINSHIFTIENYLRHQEQQRQVALLYNDLHTGLYAEAQAHYRAANWPQALECLQHIQETGGTHQNIERLVQVIERHMAREGVAPAPKHFWTRLGSWLFVPLLALLLLVPAYFTFKALIPFQPPPTAPATLTHSNVLLVFQATATPTPSLTPSPTSRPQCRIVSNALNLRSGPGFEYGPPLRALPYGNILLPLAREPEGQWIQVEVEESGQVGWVSAGRAFVLCDTAPADLRVGSIPPTPTPSPTSTSFPPIPTPSPVSSADASEDGIDFKWSFEFSWK